MNKTKIEWSDYTWNPITGCYHKCEYCYARKMALRFGGDVRLNLADERCKPYIPNADNPIYILDNKFVTRNDRSVPFPFGFAPTLHRYRFNWLDELKNGSNIFVCSMADMFGSWVPDEWIKEIFDVCEKYPRHNFLFLTKNPARYSELAEKGILRKKSNFWYGSSTPTPSTDFFFSNEYKTFVSIEPILAPFTDTDAIEDVIKLVDWVILGAETGNRKGKIIPRLEWFADLVKIASENGVPVMMKDSLVSIVGEGNMKREFPKELTRKELSEKLKKVLLHHCGNCKQIKNKSEMYAISARKGRGGFNPTVGYICDDCYEEFIKGFDLDNGSKVDG